MGGRPEYPSMNTFKIGEVARQAGIPVDTVRYYERTGLLPDPVRRPSGYRVYGLEAIRRLRFIRRAKALGFTLVEIEDLLAVSDQRDVHAIRAVARDKLADLDRRIGELTRIREALAKLVDHCPGRGESSSCPILAALNDEAEAGS